MAVNLQQALRNHIVDHMHEYPYILKNKPFYDMFLDEEIEGEKSELIADAFDTVQQVILSHASEKELAILQMMMFNGIHFYLYVNPEDPYSHLRITIYARE